MLFRKQKRYDDEAEKAKMKGLQSRISSEKLIMERKKLEKKERNLRRENSPFAQFGKAISKKVNQKPKMRNSGKRMAQKIGKPTYQKPKKNPLDDFFK
jgi:hypothetical protein